MIPSRILVFPLVMTICACICFGAKGSLCFPPSWAGIVPGITEDRDVITLYGKGLFSDQLGHSGGRYYTDPKKSATLIVELGVDWIVESVEIRTGLTPPEGSFPKDLVISRRFEPDTGFGKWRQLHLGSTQNQVRSNLGEPSEINKLDDQTESWVYQTDYVSSECYAEAYIVIRFSEGKIVSVQFYNGE